MAEKEQDNLGADSRDVDYSTDKDIRKKLTELYGVVSGAFDDKSDQSDTIQRCWDVYNCEFNDQQSYNGTSQVYVPVAHDLIEARVTRFVNQLFPPDQRCADIVSTDGDVPYELISLLENYVKKAKLRDLIVPALVRAGDVTGQYSVFIEPFTDERHVVKRVQRSKMQMDGVDVPGAEDDQINDVEAETIKDFYPQVTVIDARDLAVVPANVDRIDDAEVVAVVTRMSKDAIEKKIASKDYNKEDGEKLLLSFTGNTRDGQQQDTAKQSMNAAGVKTDGKGGKIGMMWTVFHTMKVKGERRRMVTVFGGPDLIMTCRRLPYWCDRVPVLSVPAVKVPGSFFGKSRVANGIEKMQYAVNDMVNMALDSAQYSLLPIVMTDPEKNPRVGSMIMSMAAVWEVNPQSTQFVTMPQLWKDALSFVAAIKDQMMTTLGTNPAMIPNGNASKKPTQAQVAQEQQVAMLSTADVVTIIENGVLNDLLRWFYELDYQYREEPVLVKMFGQMGIQAVMQEVQPIQVGARYEFNWYGSEGTRSAQQVQQMIAFTNVLKEIPPQMMDGIQLNLAPLVEFAASVVYGARLGPKIIVDKRHQQMIDPEQENGLLINGFPVQTHMQDDDTAHIQAHQQILPMDGQEQLIRGHILEHIKQVKMKQAAQQQQMAGPPQQGGPRPGAQPAQGRPAQGPPGMINQDQMQDPGRMPQ